MDYYDYYDEYEDEGISFTTPLLISIALGIYLVYTRYHSIQNRAIPYKIPIPKAIENDYEAPKIEDPALDSHLRDPELAGIPAPEHRHITAYDPATSLHLGTFVADNATDIAYKIEQATRAKGAWSRTSFAERRRVIRSLNKWLVDNQEACARVAARDTGKTLLDAYMGEIIPTCAKAEWLVKHGERYLRPEQRHSSFLTFYKKAEVHFEPLGVVAAIVSWNYPLHNLWSPIMAALFAGNAIVVKCSENVVWSSMWFVEAVRACLRACGHNEEIVQLCCCYPDQAEALTRSPYIRHITFIGSEEVGRKVAQAATDHLTPVTLELGGKDPAILLPSTDIDKWSSVLMRGVFQNAGQNCIGIERIIVHSSQYERVLRMFIERASELRLGSALLRPTDGVIPTVDCGAMISNDRFDALDRVLESAQMHGAVVEQGGRRYSHSFLNGAYYEPTVVGNVDPEGELAQQEVFAPFAVIMKYEEVEEAIAIANNTRYGLGASVFGPDQEKCYEVAQQLQCGMVSINDFAVYYINQDLPFGGTKMSGYGRFGGPEGLRALTNPKAIISDRWPWLFWTVIPRVVDYPIPSVTQSSDFMSGMIGFFFADGWRKRYLYLLQLIRSSRQQQPSAPRPPRR